MTEKTKALRELRDLEHAGRTGSDKDLDMMMLATAPGSELAPQEESLDFSADAGAGLEETRREDFAIPMLYILQGLSPAVVDGIEGARPGRIMDNIDNRFYDRVVVVPCAFMARYIEWAPRESGGGFKGEHLPIDVENGKVGETFIDKFGVERKGVKVVDKESGAITWNLLRDTRTHYCMLVHEDGSFKPVVISMSSTQIKKSKRWLAMIQNVQERDRSGQHFTPPSFSRLYELSSVKESNAKGNWNGWSIGSLGKVTSAELYERCREFNKLVMSGTVKTSHEDVDTVDASEERTGF